MLLALRETLCDQIAELDRQLTRQAKAIPVCRRFMTVPGVGVIVALSVWAAIDDPGRFAKSPSVGAYLGLTPRRYASGELDRQGRITKRGDLVVRTHLYEAANVLLTRIDRFSALKAWGLKIAKRSGFKKAKVAVARKLAVILHRIWRDGTEFRWGKEAPLAA
jgi:transposase